MQQIRHEYETCLYSLKEGTPIKHVLWELDYRETLFINQIFSSHNIDLPPED